MENRFTENYDVIVIGAGHAGVEAGLATARMGCKTLLATINLDMVAFMPCNPSIGGSAKGIVVREIDALGGEMGRNIDKTYIQMKMLNTGKGPAVRALRAQADKADYSRQMKRTVEQQENLTLRQTMIDEILVEEGRVVGVRTATGQSYAAKAVVVTTGTALRGEIIIGDLKYSSGPNNSLASIKLADNLKELGLEIGRFKTGTPPRVNAKSINYAVTEIQPGDETPNHFSFLSKDEDYLQDQIPCWLTYTNQKSHDIINANLHRAPMFSGIVKGVGPRYCPSIEDKIVRFADKERHQLFLEPEGRDTDEIYIQGLSTSLPEDVQKDLVHSIAGLENAQMMRTGYAIEYDYFDPRDLLPNMENRHLQNLFFAGQINGTTGYEEAAAQGLLAGINAALRAQDKDPWAPRRDQAYIGVMMDDLSTLGTKEPYRMFTSRAEYRLLLREDNADLRLTAIGRELGLVDDNRWAHFNEKLEQIEQEQQRLRTTWVNPTSACINDVNALLQTPLAREHCLEELLRRPEVTYDALMEIEALGPRIPLDQAAEQVEIQVKYAGYIDRQQDEIDKQQRNENTLLPADLDYADVSGLSNEVRLKLNESRPATIGQATRISGITPAAISILLVYLKKRGLLRKSA